MRYIENAFENKLYFWAILGPSIIILTLLVSLMKYAPESFYLPLALVVGVPSCWMWRLRGMLASITLLFFLLLGAQVMIPAQDHLWHIGISCTVALGFVVITLAREELSDLVYHMHTESKGRLDYLLRLDEKLKQTTDFFDQEKIEAARKVEGAFEETCKVKNQLISLQSASQERKKENERLLDDRQKFLTELVQLKELKTVTDEQLTVTKKTVERLETKLVQHLLKASSVLERKTELQNKLNEIRSEKFQWSIDKLGLEKRAKQPAETVEVIKEIEVIKEVGVLKEVEVGKEIKLSSQPVALDVCVDKRMLRDFSEELPVLRQYKVLYKQLKKQFEDKSDVLHLTRSELFHKEGELLTILKEKELHVHDELGYEGSYLRRDLFDLEKERDLLLKEAEILSEIVHMLMQEQAVGVEIGG